MVMDVDSMRSMYSQYLFQQKQVVYLEQVKKDLQLSLAQLKNTAEIPKAYQRKESLPINQVFSLVDNTKNTIRRVSDLKSRKNSYPLMLIVEGTKKLVDKLHTGSEGLAERGFPEQLETMFTLENRLILLLSNLNKKMEYLKDSQEQVQKQVEEVKKSKAMEEPAPPVSSAFSKDDEKIKYEGYRKKTYEEIIEEKEKEDKPKTPPKQSPY
jgi:hypothetical protein